MPSRGKQTPARIVDLESLARGYTEISIKRLGGFITAPNVDHVIAIRAIELMLDRGYGTVEQRHKVLMAGAGEGGQIVVQINMPPKE
jgi:hypothetical protein